MANHNRVNLDGKGISETRVAATSLMPGTVAYISSANKKFTQAANANQSKLYVISDSYFQGKSISDAVTAGDSAIGYYMEEGREFAGRVPAGTYVKDQPLMINASGQFAAISTTAGTYVQVATVADESITVGAGLTDTVRVRISEHRSITVS